MLIQANSLTKKYGKKTVLKNINLKIDRGELIAYLGTNGAGKSTTINILTGLSMPTSGSVSYANGLRIGVVFQNSVLDDRLTVKDNLYLRAKMYHQFSEEWLNQLIELIGIKKFINQKYGTLSGGQRRRVDIARALVSKPDLLFLDEPTTGLDLQTRLVIWQLLQKLRQEQGLTIFLTTHYLEEAENADQMYILENGMVLANGSAEEIKSRYAPTKLILEVSDSADIMAHYHPNKFGNGHLELVNLSPSEALSLLTNYQETITDFEYKKGSIDDAFIAITGKELQ